MAKKQPLDDNDREELSAYLDGEADQQTARAIEAKLSVDPAVRQEAEALKRAWDMLDYLPRPEPSPSFTHRTLERLSAQMNVVQQRRRRWRPWLYGIGWAASVLVAFSAGALCTHAWLARQRQDAEQQQHLVREQFDQQLVKDLNMIENLRVLEHVDDIDFLHKLANPNDADMFGDENTLGS